MATKKMGYESLLYYGAAGSTAATQITNCRDVNYNVTPQTAPTTVKGAGSSPPIETVRVVGRQAQLTWTMLDKSDDSTLTALRAAAANGTIFAAHTTQVLTHSIRIRNAAGTAFYLMVTDAATNRS